MTVSTVYGIFGWPVAHSRSPALHNAAFHAMGIPAVYVAFPVAPQRLADAVLGVRAMGIAGLNVTLPHKTAIMDLLDDIDPAAAAIGAVNTVYRDGDRLIGENTDAAGLARSLNEAGVDLTAKHVTVVGAGGAARAAVVGLGGAGARQIRVAARRMEASRSLAAQLDGVLPNTSVAATAMESLAGVLATTDVLVQATSATLGDTPEARAFAASLPLLDLPAHAVVVDLVYQPRVTSVLRASQNRGLTTIDGTGMLLHQGALAFERWIGKPAPLTVMRSVFEAAS
ncbi:MAG: shikimate dehydrogenase [Myxococcales bacterium]|nr:shikimate dehydrogenase [Myxococcales bacterium]